MFLQAGSTFPLTAPQLTLTTTPFTATGGTITTNGSYTIHTFTSSGTFTASAPINAQVLVVGGGGAGGTGGGGAGGVVLTSISVSGATSVVVGAGGSTFGSVGQNSSFFGIVGQGGGGGGVNTNVVSPNPNLNGGCGGGGNYATSSSAGGIGSQGFNGGASQTSDVEPYGLGGGGGMGGAGLPVNNGGSAPYGVGGAGKTYTIGGQSYTLAGGGGGFTYLASTYISGGSGGGGRGGYVGGVTGSSGTANTGSGGGGSISEPSGSGGSGIVIIAYTTNSGNLVLTNQGGVLAQNGIVDIPTSQWSTTPAINNTIYMDANHVITNSGNNLYYNGNLIANASDISNISDWALYAASADIQCSNGANPRRSILNASNVTANGTITGSTVVANTISNATNLSIVSGATSSGLLSNSFPQITNSAFSSISNVVDRLVDVGGDANYSIIAKNGNRGNITLQANSGDNNEVAYGKINLTANGTKQTIDTLQYSYGGLIEMYANTPILTGAGVVATSAVKINGGGVNIYAGSFNSFGSLAGQLYLWGQLGASLTASASPPSPIVAGSVYIYGSNGTKMDGLVQMSNLSNISGSAFVINGGGNASSLISNFNTIRGDTFYGTAGNFGAINVSNIVGYTAGVPITLTTTALSTTYPSITLNSQSNINLITSNSGKVLYNGVEVLTTTANPNWSTIPATQSANLSNYDLSNVGNVRGGTTLGLYATTIGVNGTVDMGGNSINNAYGINSTSGLYLFGSNTASLSARSSATSGQVIINAGSNYHLITMSAGFGMSIVSSNSLLISSTSNTISGATTISNTLNRVLGSTAIAQPITQYGNGSGTGNAGNITITIPTAYSSSTSYNVFITHTNGTPPNLSVVKNTSSQFTIYWTSAGAGTQPFDWMTIGT
jgi:hypothetical protein